MITQECITLTTNSEYKKIITMVEYHGGEWCATVRLVGCIVRRSKKYSLRLLRELESSGLLRLEVKRGRNGYTKITLLHPAAPGKAAEERAAISPADAEDVLSGMRERREWLDVVRYRSGARTYEEAEARFPEFLALMKTRGKTWARESDLIEHFANWLAKRLRAERPRAARRREDAPPPAPTATLERAYELITNQKIR